MNNTNQNQTVDAMLQEWLAEQNKRYSVLYDIQWANIKLKNRELTLSVKANQPTYGKIEFIHENLSKFDSLKKFCGDYWFVVPVQGSATRKVLRGEKKIKYK